VSPFHRTLTVCLGLLVGGAALAGANKIPHWSLATDEDAAKAVKTLAFTTEGKVGAWPKRIAIPYFVARYDQREVSGDLSVTTLAFPESDYNALTDALYDLTVERLTAAGFEVVPRDRVLGAAAYAALEGETGSDGGEERFRGVPTGMKYLPSRNGQPNKANDLAALNRELGTDAVVAIFANFGLCAVDYTPDTKMSGTKPCLRGNLLHPGLSLLFLGGAEGEGDAVKPTWTSRAFKEVSMFTYQTSSLQTTGETAEVYDAALIARSDAVSWSKANFWGNKTGDPQAGAFANGVRDMFDVALTLAMESFYDRNNDALTAAGLKRPARAPQPPGTIVDERSAKDMKDENAALIADLEAQKAALAAAPAGAPTVGGKVQCYHAPAGPPPANETVLKRGFEPGKAVDDSVALAVGVGPVRSVVSYTIGAGTFDVADAKATWSGKGTFEGPADGWTAWKEQLAFAGGYTADVTGTADAAGMHVVSAVKAPDGTVAMTVDQRFTLLDAAACDAKWKEIEAYVAPPIGAKPESTKKKK
jgi:hypothetical protein